MEEDDAAAEHVVSQRVVCNTRANYRGKINNIVLFLLSTPNLDVHVNNENNLIVPLPNAVIVKIFGWLSTNTDLPKKKGRIAVVPDDDGSDADEAEGEDGNQPIDVFAQKKVTISHSCMQGYKSALSWYYWENGKKVINAEMNEWISKFIHGYKKTIAQKKADGVMSISEGRSRLAYTGYNAICYVMMTLTPEGKKFPFAESIFAWPYMVISWNLMSRCGSVATIMLEHVDWSMDALVITLAKHKGDQTGEGLGNMKHVYANPFNPKVCPLLALAVMMFSTHRPVRARTHQLFEGIHSDDRFVKILQIIIAMIPESILGASRKDIGTHSNRKGSVSYVLAFCYVTAVQVYLRAGWSLGNTQDRYIFAGPGGDQLVGRAVCGLPINGTDVSTLSMNESDKVFDGAYMELLRELYSGEQYRAGAKSINTVANRLCKRKHSET